MSVSITVPMIPPSVNSYVRHARGGHYKSLPAKRFIELMGLCAANAGAVSGKAYQVVIIIYLGKGDRGDVDNFCKLPLDGLVKVGVIDTDDKVTLLTVLKRRDRANPRTEILVQAIPEKGGA